MTAAIVVAGGRATRMGGADKANLDVHGRPLIDAAYAAVADADPVIAVGPASITRPGVRVVREDPPFGGPVAAVAAALTVLERDSGSAAETWLLACDLPRAALIVAQLREVPIPDDADAVILVDDGGREQWLAGRYRVASLRSAVATLPEVRDVSVRRLVAALRVRTVPDRADAALDLDTLDELRQYRDQEDRP